MITVDEVKKAYAISHTTPHVGSYIDSNNMLAHPLGALALSRNVPIKSLYEYFGPAFVDDFNVGFFDQHFRLVYSQENYELGRKFREMILTGELSKVAAGTGEAEVVCV